MYSQDPFIVFCRAIYSDAAVVVDQNLISSRVPADLPDFCKAILTRLNAK